MSDKPCMDKDRRNWLIATSAVGGVGAAAALYPFVDSFEPSERAKAAGAAVEIDIAGIEKYQWEEIKPQVDHVIFPASNGQPEKRLIILAKGRLVNLGCGTGHPSYVMSSSFANQVIAQIELWNAVGTTKYPIGVYTLPKHLDEKVARLQLKKLNAQLTELTDQQAAYIGVTKEGPYKADHYRY